MSDIAHTNNAPAPLAKSKSLTIAGLLADKQASLAAVATKHLTPEKLMKMILAQVSRTPKLGQCTPLSVLQAAMTLAELGITPGVLGNAYLIPFDNRNALDASGRKTTITECQLIIGYRGMMTLARRSGEITTIMAEVVHEGDEFTLDYSVEGCNFYHKPKGGYYAKILGAWALARFRDGSHQFVFMSRDEIDGIQGRSKAKDSGPWVSDYPEMAKKTVVRRLCKFLPLTAESEEAIDQVDRTEFSYEDVAGQEVGTPTAPAGQTAADKVAAAAASRTGTKPFGKAAPVPQQTAPAPKVVEEPEPPQTAQEPLGVDPDDREEETTGGW